MAQYIIHDPEDLVVCPYDKVHMVRAKRFQYHLIKCRRNYLGMDFAVCPFNARHEMPRPELRYHVANCADKVVVEPEIMYAQMKDREDDGTYFKGDTSVPAYHHNNTQVPPTEDWDIELPSYPTFRGDPELFREKHLEIHSGRPVLDSDTMHQKLRQEFDRKCRLGQLVSSSADSASDSEGPSGLRRPKHQPLAMRATSGDSKASMAMAGVGRGALPPGAVAGKTVGRQVNAPVKLSMGKVKDTRSGYFQEQAELLQHMCRGRGIGRGTTLESVTGSALPSVVPPTLGGLGRGVTVAQDNRRQPGPMFVVPRVGQLRDGGLTSTDSSVCSDSETDERSSYCSDTETITSVEPASCTSTDTEYESFVSDTETEKADDSEEEAEITVLQKMPPMELVDSEEEQEEEVEGKEDDDVEEGRLERIED